ncbi:WD40-repeat-containing domain protein, partial [Phlyctochytrium arcticum]
LIKTGHFAVDMQGINWAQLPIPRDKFRDSRVRNYGNYRNLSMPRDKVVKECIMSRRDGAFYKFRHAQLEHKCHIVHFQLRNLVWATSKQDVFFTNRNGVCHWCPLTRTVRPMLDLKKVDMGGTKISSMVAKHDVLMVGGFTGEWVVKSMEGRGSIAKGCVTTDVNGITNHLDVEIGRSGAKEALISSNDQCTRVMDLETMQVTRSIPFDWPVNCTTMSPDKRLLCVVGDSIKSLVVDSERGTHCATLEGHVDYSFACAWSPCGRLLATGNQDMTVRLYDTRNFSKTLAVLPASMGAVRSIRFSDDARYLVFAEPADFVHVVDLTGQRTGTGDVQFARPRRQQQVIDFFGEIAGVALPPGGDGMGPGNMFIGIADPKYGGIIELERNRPFSQVLWDTGLLQLHGDSFWTR